MILHVPAFEHLEAERVGRARVERWQVERAATMLTLCLEIAPDQLAGLVMGAMGLALP